MQIKVTQPGHRTHIGMDARTELAAGNAVQRFGAVGVLTPTEISDAMVEFVMDGLT